MSLKCPRCPAFNLEGIPFCVQCGWDIRLGAPEDPFYGQCWFCETEGKLTKEHIISRWAFAPAGLAGKRYTHQIGRPSDATNAKSDFVYRPGRLARRATIEGHWAPVACEECNNGWMSQLQLEVRPIAEAFIAGCQSLATVAEASILARWIGTMAACAEYYAGPPVIPQFQRTMLMLGDPYPQWLFSYARSGSDSLNGTCQISNAHAGAGEEGIFKGFLVSCRITIGATVFHCLAAPTSWAIFHAIGPYPMFQSKYGLRSVWPPMAPQPLGNPNYLTMARIRRAQVAIRTGILAPNREFEPDDVAFML